MKIIRWLLSHTLLILLIVAVIYGYMYWGNLAGENTPAGKAISYLSNEFEEVGEFVAATKLKQEELNQKNSSAPESSEVESSARSSEAPEPIPENEMVAVIEPVASGTQIQLTDMLATEPATEPAAEKAVEQSVENNIFTAPVAQSSNVDIADIEMTGDNNSESSQGNGSVEQQVSITYSYNNTRDTLFLGKNTAGDEVAAEPVIIEQQVVESADEADTTDYQTSMAQAKSAVSSTQHDVKAPVLSGYSPLMAVNTAASANNEANDTFVSAKIEKQLDNVDKHGRVINPSMQDGDIKASWITARKSFYRRDYVLSEQKYKDIIDNTKDNYDAYGELGNVYFNQGKRDQAATAYYEAAAILARKGKTRRARSLVGLLRSLDKSKADELQKLIDDSYQP
jgi:tetratricopeptide (TPR) repeat protein